jgi:hypothetical protein
VVAQHLQKVLLQLRTQLDERSASTPFFRTRPAADAIPGLLITGTCAGHAPWPTGLEPYLAALDHGPYLGFVTAPEWPFSRVRSWPPGATIARRCRPWASTHVLTECLCEQRCGGWTVHPPTPVRPTDRVAWFTRAVDLLETAARGGRRRTP